MEFHFIPLSLTESRRALFLKALSLPFCCSQNSPPDENGCARWNILTASPQFLLEAEDSTLFFSQFQEKMRAISNQVEQAQLHSSENYQYYDEYWRSLETEDDYNPTPPLPGFFGFLSYDLLAPLKKNEEKKTSFEIPGACLGFYPWIIVFNTKKAGEAALISCLDQAQTEAIKQWIMQNQPFPESLLFTGEKTSSTEENTTSFCLESPFVPDENLTYYHDSFEKIMHHLKIGDCYQVNFAQRFTSKFKGHPALAYLKLIEKTAAPFAVYFQAPKYALVSASPERFLSVSGKKVASFPIKGTMKRDSNKKQDITNAQYLETSEKNKAENLMIVDLLRNDMSHVAEKISVPVLFKLKRFKNVFHLESIVSGLLKQDYNAINLLEACFPGGSITGAPKAMAMNIIEALETKKRTVYCGTFIHLDLLGALNSNILIRTLLTANNHIYVWSGGGIVSDSDAASEYQETLDKVDLLLRTLSNL